MMSSKKASLLFGIAVAALTAAPSVVAQTREAGHTVKFGGKIVGGKIRGAIVAGQGEVDLGPNYDVFPIDGIVPHQLVSVGKLTLDATVFGKDHHLVKVKSGVLANDAYRFRMSDQYATKLASLVLPAARPAFKRALQRVYPVDSRRGTFARIDLASYTLLNATNGGRLRLTKNFGPFGLIRVKKTWMVGPVPVTVKGALLVGAGLDITASSSFVEKSAEVDGKANGFASGILSAGADIFIASAGVRSTMKFANSTAGVFAKVRKSAAPQGKVILEITPIEFRLYLFASLFGLETTLKIYSWSAKVKSFARSF